MTHKLVPIEPTMGMVDAAFAAYENSNKPAPYNQMKDAIIAALSAAPNGWQDIKTLPDEYKDGKKKFDVWHPQTGRVVNVVWSKHHRCPSIKWKDGMTTYLIDYTHWMPLPAAPEVG